MHAYNDSESKLQEEQNDTGFVVNQMKEWKRISFYGR